MKDTETKKKNNFILKRGVVLTNHTSFSSTCSLQNECKLTVDSFDLTNLKKSDILHNTIMIEKLKKEEIVMKFNIKKIKLPTIKWGVVYEDDIPIEELKLNLRTTRRLKIAKINTIRELKNLTLEKFMKTARIGAEVTHATLEYLFKRNHYLADFDPEVYEDIDAYIIDKIKCKDCGCELDGQSNAKTQRCQECDEKANRRSMSEVFEISITDLVCEESEKHIKVIANLINLTEQPVKYIVKEVSALVVERQVIGRLEQINDEIALPYNVRTISSVINCEAIPEVKFPENLTIYIQEVVSQKVHCYVYAMDESGEWKFDDYYSINEEM